MKSGYVLHGSPGHPLHPPLTDATIGIYTAATAFGVLSVLGVSEHNMATAWWLALVIGLVVTVPTALAGLADWIQIERGTQLWRTATAHMLSMVAATVFFLLAAIWGHAGYVDAAVRTGPLVLNLVGFGLLTLGGMLGGALVFVYGKRVLSLTDEPLGAASPTAPGGAAGERMRPQS